jgi:hypothetical protein
LVAELSRLVSQKVICSLPELLGCPLRASARPRGNEWADWANAATLNELSVRGGGVEGGDERVPLVEGIQVAPECVLRVDPHCLDAEGGIPGRKANILSIDPVVIDLNVT